MPTWAWFCVAACALIPVTAIGGLIPTAIGAGGAGIVLSIARQTEREEKSRMASCLGTCLLCWGLFVGFSYAVHQVWGTASVAERSKVSGADRAAAVVEDESQRKKVFAMAASALARIDATEEKITSLRREARDPGFYQRRLQRHREAHERDRNFAAEFFRISRVEVDAIVNEGIAEGWPLP